MAPEWSCFFYELVKQKERFVNELVLSFNVFAG